MNLGIVRIKKQYVCFKFFFMRCISSLVSIRGCLKTFASRWIVRYNYLLSRFSQLYDCAFIFLYFELVNRRTPDLL